jgi:hypothetical protein
MLPHRLDSSSPRPPSTSKQRTPDLRFLKGVLRRLGGRAVDRRTHLGKALAHWRASLISDLGGARAISTQQAALVDLAVITKLLLDSVDTWLLTQPSLVNARKRALLPAVRERQQLVDSLARILGQLGLERRGPEPIALDAYLSDAYGAPGTRTPVDLQAGEETRARAGSSEAIPDHTPHLDPPGPSADGAPSEGSVMDAASPEPRGLRATTRDTAARPCSAPPAERRSDGRR